MIRRRRLVPAACAAALALTLYGCGGGGGGGAEQGDVPPPQNSVPIATGASPAESATLAIASLGVPGSVDPAAAARTLAGHESFGTPHDPFVQQVDTRAGSGSEATVGESPLLADTPITGDPLVALPGGTGSIPGGDVNDAPIQNPVAYEADFDVSGEPIVALVGDAIPPETQQFEIESITAGQVVLRLVGGLLPDGGDTVTLKEGESITLFNATAGRSYTIKLVDIRRA